MLISLYLTPLISDSEPQFWTTVERDICDYFFLVYNWLYERNKTEIFLAKKDNAVEGLMVIYDGIIAQLRGNREAVAFMLKSAPCKLKEVQVPLNCRDR